MMYNKLYRIWRQELESDKLEKLPPKFYLEVTKYLKKIEEESRMLDKRTTKAFLLKREKRNVRRMVYDIIWIRYKKWVRTITNGKKMFTETLTTEEKKIYSNIHSIADVFQKFAENVLHGYLPVVEGESEHKRSVLRFLKDVPSIIGADMKGYGPFKIEDVASLPIQNARSLVKERLAEVVEA